MLIFFLVLIVVDACTTAEKIKCSAALIGCGAICVCDVPACECCVPCLACVTATAADCCDCLFPGWSGCSSIQFNKTVIGFDKIKMININRVKTSNHCSYTECGGRNETICCPDTHKAICECSKPNNSVCSCIYSDVINTEACASVLCDGGFSRICCPEGHAATCTCIGRNPDCQCY